MSKITKTKKENTFDVKPFKKLATKNKDKISNLNSGGCICFAFIMAHHLEHLGIKYEIVAFDDSFIIWFHKLFLKFWVTFNKSDYISFNHVMLKVDDWYIDGYQVFHKKQVKKEKLQKWWYLFSTKLSLDQLGLCYNFGDWNKLYDRNQNPKVFKHIKWYIK